MAKAPYNFIPLNDQVVPSEWTSWEDLPDFDRYHTSRKGKEFFSGKIDVLLTTLTPTYIRDLRMSVETDPVDFFGCAHKAMPIIPGSSFRGMVRGLVEILSFGLFQNFDDKQLYFRGLADPSNLREEYNKVIFKDNSNTELRVEAGYLDRDRDGYFIIPAEVENGVQYTKVEKCNREEFTVIEANDGKHVVISGDMPKKKNDWLVNKPDDNSEKIRLSEKDIDSYKNDLTRYKDKSDKEDSEKKDGDLLRHLEVNKSQGRKTPCFFIRNLNENHTDILMGHTVYFRIPYNKRICDHVPRFLRDDTKMDMANAIFGKPEKAASRVFFEDLFFDNPEKIDKCFMKPTTPKILSSPKPTTFQHYLEQTNRSTTHLKNWNSNNSKIRGYKVYWHRNTQGNSNYSWAEKEIIEGTQRTLIKPIKPGYDFRGRIRFENLSKIELGAILTALVLPEKCHHKIGMGKPLGLGSVKIEVNVRCIDRETRYFEIFDNNDWNSGEYNEEGIVETSISEFHKYVLSSIGSNETDYWKLSRMDMLRTMLSFNKSASDKHLENTRYLLIEGESGNNEFSNRPVLPTPT